MGTFSTTVMAFRKSALERASIETGIKLTMATDEKGVFTRFTLDELPDDPQRWMAQVNLFNRHADMVFERQLQNEVVARILL